MIFYIETLRAPTQKLLKVKYKIITQKSVAFL